MCADFWMVILQQPGVMCYTLFNKGIHRACFVCLTSTHLHNVPKTALIWKSEKYQHVIFASVFAQVPAEKASPLERSHRVHTPAGTQRWVGSAGGEAGMRAKGRKRWETQRPEGAISCRGHTTVRCSCWGDTSVTMLYCTVFTFVL